MIGLEELYNQLLKTHIPFAYNDFPKDKTPPMPYGVYSTARANPFYADGMVYAIFGHIQVDLYTKRKRPDLEKKVESALEGVTWTKSEDWNPEEKCCIITYELEVKDNGK